MIKKAISGDTIDERYPVEDRPWGRYMREHQQDREERERLLEQMKNNYSSVVDYWEKEKQSLAEIAKKIKKNGENLERLDKMKDQHIKLLRKGM